MDTTNIQETLGQLNKAMEQQNETMGKLAESITIEGVFPDAFKDGTINTAIKYLARIVGHWEPPEGMPNGIYYIVTSKKTGQQWHKPIEEIPDQMIPTHAKIRNITGHPHEPSTMNLRKIANKENIVIWERMNTMKFEGKGQQKRKIK